MQKFLIGAGLLLLLAGLLWPWLGKFPFGRLPGDILLEKENLKVYIPITTMILISALVSLLLWIFRK